jgi:hypothetical protein
VLPIPIALLDAPVLSSRQKRVEITVFTETAGNFQAVRRATSRVKVKVYSHG